jgi:histidinol-phosphate aminotransferase
MNEEKNSFDPLIRPDLYRFKPYASARSENVSGQIWLNANESPWAIETESGPLNRYPEKQPLELINALADYYQVFKEQLLVTRGSDEGIDLLTRLFCIYKQDAVFSIAPTFGMYQTCAEIQGVDYLTYTLDGDKDFHLDTNAFIQAVPRHAKLVFLCRPNNPTGTLIALEAVATIAKVLQGHSVVVVDEAYIEFADKASAVQLINTYDNVVVLRTLSKSFGLAGVRAGVMLGDGDLIRWLYQILPPYPVAKPCVKAILDELDSDQRQRHQKRIALIKSERQRVAQALRRYSIVRYIWPSHANFLLVRFHYATLFEACLEYGVVLRNMATKLNDGNILRITIGTEQENDKLINTIAYLNQCYETE